MKTVFSKIRFIHILSVLMVLISGAGGFVVLLTPDFPGEMKGAVVTLMMIGGFTGVQNFWLGSSAGSERKDRQAVSDRAAQREGDV